MQKLDAANNELLRACCQKCLDLYNALLGTSYEYDDLFLLNGIESGDEEIRKMLGELSRISMELENCSVVIDDESYDDKLEQMDILKQIQNRLAGLESSIRREKSDN